MPVPSTINDLSATPGSNGPVGSTESPSSLDDYLRAHAAFIAQLRDGKPSNTGTGASGTWNISISGNAATATTATNATTATTVTDGVYTTGNQTIGGNKTFSGVTTLSGDRLYQTGQSIGFEMGPGVGTGDINRQGFYVPAGKSLYLAGNANGAVIELGPSGVTFPTGLTLPTSAVNAATAGSSVGGIGTFAFCRGFQAEPGSTYAGSSLNYTGGVVETVSRPVGGGTWRAMGYTAAADRGTLYLRIA